MPIIIVSANRAKGLEAAYEQATRLMSKKKSCGQDLSFTHPDLKLVTGDPTIGIEQVKELIRYLSRKPYQSNVVVGIIHPGETLTTEAENSLLKTLEEPPEFAHIFITTTHLSALLPTVRSRCQVITLSETAELETPPIAVADLIDLPLTKRLKKIESLLKEDRTITPQVVISWVDHWIIEARGDAPLIRKLVEVKRLLQANVTPLHALDTLTAS